jgi:hypothetical protein
LKWWEELFEMRTWPRENYRKFMLLVVVSLGGLISSFRFRLPGPDYHAHWMSKGIYVIKIYLLSKVFKCSGIELSNIRRIFILTVVIYAKAWLTSPLSISAARNDLTFHCYVLRYREMEPTINMRAFTNTNVTPLDSW